MVNSEILKRLFFADHFYAMRVFRKAVYAWIVLNLALLLPNSQTMQDFELKIIASKTWAFNLLAWLQPQFNFLSLLLIALCFISLVDIFFIESRINSILIFSGFYFIESICLNMWDGGVNIMHLLCFFLIFATPKSKSINQGPLDSFSNVVDNCVIYASRFQVVLVYFCAGALKLKGELWPKGMALFYTLNIDQFTTPFFKEIVQSVPELTVLATYMVLCFQISFPFLVWLAPTRRAYLLVGTIFHLGIAIGMGLFGFGLAMCASYFAFIENHRAKKFLLFGKNLFAKIFFVRSVNKIKEHIHV